MVNLKKVENVIRSINSENMTNSHALKVLANKSKGFIVTVLRSLLLFGLIFIILYPLVYMFSVTFRQPKELLDPTVVWIPKTITLENVKTVVNLLHYPEGLLRSAFLALVCSVLQVFTCGLTGYGFARFKFKFRNLLFFAAIFTLIVPPQAIMMPLYINFTDFTEFTRGFMEKGIQLIDTPLPMALSAFLGTGIRSGLFIYIFRQYFKNMPVELEDAAYIDGCGPIKAYWRIMLVNAGPVLLVSFLFSFVWYWNDYFNVSLYFTNARPLAVLVANFRDTLNTSRKADATAYTLPEMSIYIQTACLLFIGPVLGMYLFLQKYFTQSIVRSGIVG